MVRHSILCILLFGTGITFGQELIGADRPPELMAVFDGMQTLVPYVQAGGRFTGQKNLYGQTAGMLAASNSAEVIEYFYKAGGRFTEERDKSGRTAAFYAVDDRFPGSQSSRERPGAIIAFAKFGGRFTDEQDLSGATVASIVVQSPADIPSFLKAGGKFQDDSKMPRYNVGMNAVMAGAASIEAFSLAGGRFNSHQVNERSAGDMANDRGGTVLETYNKAVERQGGLIYVSTDDEFSALRNPLRIKSFVKAGGHFDDRTDKQGTTAAMWAMWNGPEIAKAFVTYGGRLTSQQDNYGDTAEEYCRQDATKAIFNDAVKHQGGLITLLPADEFEAARIGAAAIDLFYKAGGRFTGRPDQNDMTSAMIAAVSGPDAMNAFVRAGGRLTDWQNALGYTVAIVSVISGPATIEAFTRAGGHFDEKQDHHGRTAALWSVARQDVGWPQAHMELHFPEHKNTFGLANPGDAAMKAFLAGRGIFNDHQDSFGQTAGMLAIENGPEAITAFAAGGGRFTEQEDRSGRTAEELAVSRTPDRIRAFAAAGGRFTTHPGSKGTSSEMVVARTDNPDMITAYSEAGGLFTDRKFAGGWTSEGLATDKSEWFWQAVPGGKPIGQPQRELLERLQKRDERTAKAYRAAVIRQGGIRHVQK